MIKTDLSTLKINKLSKAQYDRELAAGRIDENALYLTPDEGITLDDVAETSTKSYFHIIRGTSTDGRAYYGSIDESVEIQNGTIVIFIPEMTSTWYTELSLTITNKNGSEYYG